jgi:Fe-S-cluster containining protein
MAENSGAPRVVLCLALKVCNQVLEVEIKVPTAPIRAVDLLPILMSFDDAVVGVFEKETVRQGKTISCKKGCGACCRQLVPISEAEAQYLAELVAEMPPDRRERVVARFRQAREELERRGMRERLMQAVNLTAPDQWRPMVFDYFACGVACPFLEEESCSIHPDRPLICREYTVTSPPERCADPSQQEIHGIAIPIHFSNLVRRFADGEGNSPYRWLPLVLALNWASEESQPMPRLPGPQILENFLRLVRQEIEKSQTRGDLRRGDPSFFDQPPSASK